MIIINSIVLENNIIFNNLINMYFLLLQIKKDIIILKEE